MTVHVKAAEGSKITLEVELGVTVGHLKSMLARGDRANVPETQQRLIYRGHVLKDEKTLESYGACQHTHTPHRPAARGRRVHAKAARRVRLAHSRRDTWPSSRRLSPSTSSRRGRLIDRSASFVLSLRGDLLTCAPVV